MSSPSLLSCTCYVDEMMIPCQLSTFSEFIWNAFQFQGLIAQIRSKCMKNNKSSQKVLKMYDVALNGAFLTQKNSGVQISSKKWNPFVTDEFSPESLILRKRLSSLYIKCVAVTLSTFLHMLCGWNDDTMPTFNLFRVHLKCFSIQCLIAQNNQ